MNGVIHSYVVGYATEKSESRAMWNNVTVNGDKTSANLSGLLAGKRYFIRVQAATKAGLSAPNEPIIIFTGGNEIQAVSLDDEKPVIKTKEDRQLGNLNDNHSFFYLYLFI